MIPTIQMKNTSMEGMIKAIDSVAAAMRVMQDEMIRHFQAAAMLLVGDYWEIYSAPSLGGLTRRERARAMVERYKRGNTPTVSVNWQQSARSLGATAIRPLAQQPPRGLTRQEVGARVALRC